MRVDRTGCAANTSKKLALVVMTAARRSEPCWHRLPHRPRAGVRGGVESSMARQRGLCRSVSDDDPSLMTMPFMRRPVRWWHRSFNGVLR